MNRYADQCMRCGSNVDLMAKGEMDDWLAEAMEEHDEGCVSGGAMWGDTPCNCFVGRTDKDEIEAGFAFRVQKRFEGNKNII